MNRDLFAKYMRENGYTIKKLASEIGVMWEIFFYPKIYVNAEMED